MKYTNINQDDLILIIYTALREKFGTIILDEGKIKCVDCYLIDECSTLIHFSGDKIGLHNNSIVKYDCRFHVVDSCDCAAYAEVLEYSVNDTYLIYEEDTINKIFKHVSAHQCLCQ